MSVRMPVATAPIPRIEPVAVPGPAVDLWNARAALAALGVALAALDVAGYEMEHHEGPYGATYDAATAVIERAWPEVDSGVVLLDRTREGGILAALDAALAGR